MPEALSDWLIVGGVLLWDALVLAGVVRLARPSWRVPVRVPKSVPGRITYDRDEWGQVVRYEHESD